MIQFNDIKNFSFRLLNGFNGTRFNINGTEIRLDESLRRWDYSSEHGMFKVMSERLQTSDTFIDIGANFGMHAILAAKLVGPTGKVLAIEPLAKNIAYLNTHAKLNKLNNFRTIKGVISNSELAEIEFFFPDEEFIQTGGLKSNRTGDRKLLVRNIHLDDLADEVNNNLKMIKIDVEGAEMDVILSGERFLRQYQPDLLIEIHGFALPDFGHSTQGLLAKLNDLGYVEERIPGPDQKEDYFQSLFHKK